jgi:hypothetical protein
MNTAELTTIVDNALTRFEFHRHKRTWYRTNEDTHTLVDLQKSQWGGQYYVNLGVYIRSLGENPFPQEFQCHIRGRLTAISGLDSQEIERALDLERSDFSPERRQAVVRPALETAVAFLDARSAIPQLRDLHARGQLDAGGISVTKTARDFLEQPITD